MALVTQNENKIELQQYLETRETNWRESSNKRPESSGSSTQVPSHSRSRLLFRIKVGRTVAHPIRRLKKSATPSPQAPRRRVAVSKSRIESKKSHPLPPRTVHFLSLSPQDQPASAATIRSQTNKKNQGQAAHMSYRKQGGGGRHFASESSMKTYSLGGRMQEQLETEKQQRQLNTTQQPKKKSKYHLPTRQAEGSYA